MTAGPDERILHVIPGGGPESEQDAEDRIREELRRLGVGPGGPASSPPPMPAHLPVVPPQQAAADVDQEPGDQADYGGFADWLRAKRAARQESHNPEPDDADEAEGATPARADNDRLPPWWDRRKPDLDDQTVDDEEPGEEPEEEDEEPEERPKAKARGPQPVRRRVSKTSRRPPADDGQGDEEEDEEEAGEQVPDGPRWSRPSLGRPPGLPPKRQNLITWWRQDVEDYQKWLLYHGTGLGAGVYFGVFTYGTRGAEFVTQQGLGDLEADFTVGLLGLVLMVDYRVRNLFLPLAWLVRAVSTSLVLGAAWNGTPLADLTN
ncbi:hypothetical protein ACIOFV_07390 [Streptomyces mirabilis]|uniref:hypothetical protein n=1 Tax=Streptomyces mirabilis TaxID=68239 RepID=UPI00381A84AD